MKKILVLAFIIFAAWGCSNSPKTTAEPKVEAIPDTHNAQNSLDYQGTYKSTLPCADCDSIVTSITLTEKDYTKTSIYHKNGKTNRFEETGSYKWNDAGNTITLEGIENEPNQYFVGENTLRQLDMDGKEITGNLADKYVLRK